MKVKSSSPGNTVQSALTSAEGSSGDKSNGCMLKDAQLVKEGFGSGSVDAVTIDEDWKDWHFDQKMFSRTG